MLSDAAWAAIGTALAAGFAAGLPSYFTWKTTKAIKTETGEIKHQTNEQLTSLNKELAVSREEISGLKKLVEAQDRAAEDAKRINL